MRPFCCKDTLFHNVNCRSFVLHVFFLEFYVLTTTSYQKYNLNNIAVDLLVEQEVDQLEEEGK